MPPSAADTGTETPTPAGRSLAVTAEILYLVNLLLLPGLAFLALVLLYAQRIGTASPLAACHLRQALSASLWAGVILVLANGLIIVLGGYDAPYTWVIVVLYFTVCHSALVLFGTLGLAKAMAGKPYRFPLVGQPCGK